MTANGIKIGDALIDFILPATDGKSYSASWVLGIAKALIISFLSNDCPYVLAWEARLVQVIHDYDPSGVHMLAINANDAQKYPSERFEKMTEHAKQQRFVFPYLLDENQEVAHTYGATHTPELFVFDAAGILRYHGSPDDHYQNEKMVSRPYLRNALDAILSRRSVPLPETPLIGCPIKWKNF